MAKRSPHNEVVTPNTPLLSRESGNTSCHHMSAQESPVMLLIAPLGTTGGFNEAAAINYIVGRCRRQLWALEVSSLFKAAAGWWHELKHRHTYTDRQQ